MSDMFCLLFAFLRCVVLCSVGILGVKEPITFNSVHLLSWIVMKHLIKDNERSEIYVVNNIDIDSVIVSELKPIIAANTTTKIASADGKPMSFAMARIINQIPFRLGAAYALTTLISNNRDLLLSFVNDATLLFFRDLISQWGPDKRFLEVFKAICSCKNYALPANQRSMLKLIEKSNVDEPFVVECFRTEAAWPTNEDSPMLVQTVVEAHKGGMVAKMMNPLRRLTMSEDEKKAADAVDEADDEPYLGSEGGALGFPKLFVSWTGADDWTRGGSSLYYSPAALSIPSTKEGAKRAVVSIEDLAFPLKLEEDATDDTSMVTAMDSYYQTGGDRKQAQNLFVNHKFLSDYFMEQTRLYAEMCLGRCFETSSHIANEFDFDMLYSGMANTNLPFGYRGAFSDLMRTLIVDQFPQLKNCGNYRVPVSVYVLDKLDYSNDDVNSALPTFSIPAQFESSDPLYKYKTPKKCELLVSYCSKYLSMRLGAQCSDPVFMNKNRCTLSVLNMIDKLVSFGFYDTVKELKEVVRPLILMLDGRMMTEEPEETPGR